MASIRLSREPSATITGLFLFLALAATCLSTGAASFPTLGIRLDPKRQATILEWEPGPIPVELSVSGDLQKWLPWAGKPEGVAPFTAVIGTSEPRAFFRLDPAVPPGQVAGLVAGALHDGLSLHWEPDPAASTYSLFIGDTPKVGPDTYLLAIHDLVENDYILRGFPTDKVLYLAVQGMNSKGVSAPSEAIRKAFAGTGRITGTLGVGSVDADGAPFVKAIPGMPLRLLAQPGNLESHFVKSGTDGRFEFPDVAPGEYRLAWDGDPLVFDGARKDPIFVDRGLNPLGDVLADPRPGFIAGRVHFIGGVPAVFTDRVFGLDVRPTLTAYGAQGGVLAVSQVDDDGAFAFPGLNPDEFPIVLTADFRGTQASAKIPSPQASGPVDLVLGLESVRVVSATPTQDGIRVPIVDCGRPVRIETEIDVPAQQSVSVRWVAMSPSGRVLGTAEGEDPTFKFTIDRETVIQVHGVVESPGLIPSSIDFRVAATCGLFGRFTGRVGVWNPETTESLAPIEGVVVRARIGSLIRSAVTDASGNFELTAVPHVGPMVLTLEKPGYMPWSWRFDGRPTEKEYGMVPTETITATVPAAGQPPARVFSGSLGFGFIFPPQCFTVNGVPFSGPVTIERADVPTKGYRIHPFPPNVQVDNFGTIGPSDADNFHWASIRGANGEELVPVPGAGHPVIRIYIPPLEVEVPRHLLRRDEERGVFVDAGRASGSRTEGWPFVDFDFQLTHARGAWTSYRSVISRPFTFVISADRSLNYPFDVLVNDSGFPVTVHGPGQHDIGDLGLQVTSQTEPAGRFRVIDQRQAPGAYFANLHAPVPRVAFRKQVIVDFRPPVVPFFAPDAFPVRLGLGRTLPELTPANATTGYGGTPPPAPSWRVESLETENAFLAPYPAFASTGSPRHPHIAETYYAAIRAPATLAQWKGRNGFPADPGAVPADGIYLTTYYYNLGDLGFARRLTMRKTVGYDGRPNIAMAVTNFRNLDEARNDTAPIATVCMEYSRRDGTEAPRFVKFTAYDDTGALANELSLDGGAAKPMPNLCVVCHGGRAFDPVGGNPNLGSSFLPFDIESYTYHSKLGTQKAAFAQLNQGVLDTDPAPAIRELIAGWYGTGSPTSAPGAFNASFVPDGWSSPAEAPTLYHDTFRTSCRICHISRPETIQFDSFERLSLFNAGVRRQVCLVSGGMPATQRTWAIFWGGRAALKLQAAEGLPRGAVDYPAQILGRPPLANLSDLLRRR